MKSAICMLSLALFLSLSGAEAANKPISHKGTVSKKPSTLSGAPILRDFTFRGNHIGDPAEEVIHRSIKINQLGDPDDKYSYNKQSDIDYCISYLEDQGESFCSDSNSDLRVINQHSSNAIINYMFWDKKFYGFWMSFNDFLFDDMKALLIAKYGRPHKMRIEKVQNLMGAEIDQLVLTWFTPYGPMDLTSHSPNYDQGFLTFSNLEVIAKKAQLRQKSIQERAKSAF